MCLYKSIVVICQSAVCVCVGDYYTIPQTYRARVAAPMDWWWSTMLTYAAADRIASCALARGIVVCPTTKASARAHTHAHTCRDTTNNMIMRSAVVCALALMLSSSSLFNWFLRWPRADYAIKCSRDASITMHHQTRFNMIVAV